MEENNKDSAPAGIPTEAKIPKLNPYKIPGDPARAAMFSDILAKATADRRAVKDTFTVLSGPGPHYEPLPATPPFTIINGERQYLYKPQTDEEGRKKTRNACISGHMGDEASRCEHCKLARFNALTSGWYGDSPTPEQVKTFLMKTDFTASWQRTDYLFVLKYLDLPDDTETNTEERVSAFMHKVSQIDNLITLSALWNSSGQFMVIHPLLRQVYNLPNTTNGKSAFMEHLIIKDPFLLDIYSHALIVGFEGGSMSYPDKVAQASQEANWVIKDFVDDATIPTGLADLNQKLEGGLERGELMSFSARRHGRSIQGTGIPDIYHASPTASPVRYRPAEEQPSRSERRKKKKQAVVKAKASPLLRGMLVLNKYTKE